MIINSIKGYVNENLFVDRLNNKKMEELPFTLQLMIKDLFPEIDNKSLIRSWNSSFLTKTDIYIKVGEKINRASLKKGVKNSVHTESVKDFALFLKTIGIDEEMIKFYLKYHFGDGTMDGTGSTRLSSEELKKKFQTNIDKFNLELNKEEIINKAIDRFLIKGRNGTDRVSVLIYGTPLDFIWIKRNDIYKLLQNKKNQYSTGPHFSRLNIQPMNRCLNSNLKYDNGRYIVQIKWYNIYDDIIEFSNQEVVDSNSLGN